MNEEVKRDLFPKQMALFHSARKVSSFLVRATVFPLERTLRLMKYSKSTCHKCN